MVGSSGSLRRLEAVAAADVVPVARADAGAVQRSRRTADAAVVLHAAADVVERPRVVDRDPVELRQRQVGELPPGLHVVVGLVEPAVVADHHVAVIARVPDDFVVIDVHAAQLQRPPGLAAVLAARDVGPRRVDRSPGSRGRRRSRCSSRGRRRGSSRRSARRRVPVRRPLGAFARRGRAVDVVAAPIGPHAAGGAVFAPAEPAASPFVDRPPDPRPGRAGVVRAEEPALPALRGHERVDRVRILRIDAEPDRVPCSTVGSPFVSFVNCAPPSVLL